MWMCSDSSQQASMPLCYRASLTSNTPRWFKPICPDVLMHLLYPISLSWALQIDMPSSPCTSPTFDTPNTGCSSWYALTPSCVLCSTFLCRCLKSTCLDALMHLLHLTPPTFKSSCFDTFVHFMRPTHLIVGTPLCSCVSYVWHPYAGG